MLQPDLLKNRRRFLGVAAMGLSGISMADDFTVNQSIREHLDRAELSLLFTGSDKEQATRWQSRFGKQLQQLLGTTEPPLQWKTRVNSRVMLDDHTRLDLTLIAPGIPSVPVYLLIPKAVSKSKPAPAVLCVHGHGKYGNEPIVGRTDIDGVAANIAANKYDYGLQFVRRGYVVAAPCMLPFGKRVNRERYGGNDPCAVSLVRLMSLGKLPMAENLRDLRWCLSLLEQREEVQATRIGCAGLSYGGRMTMLVSAVDQRIKVASVSGALNLLQERMSARHSCGSQIIPGLLKYGDYSEIGSLIAPRPCVWETGSKDGLIVPKWDDLFRSRLRKIYAAYGAADQLHFDRFEGKHEWSGRIAYGLFNKVLKQAK